MDFTREPIIETVITPREGCKIVVRSSKASGQEEFFVDAVEVVSFGHSQFFRSLEKPKPFLVPTSDYEVLEVREARMVLKSVGIDRSIKIGGGRETQPQQRPQKEKEREREREPRQPVAPAEEPALQQATESAGLAEEQAASSATEERVDPRLERRRDRRRHYRRRRGRDEGEVKEESEESLAGATSDVTSETFVVSNGESEESVVISLEPPQEAAAARELTPGETQQISTSAFSSLLSPPPNLISETIARYRENDLFKGAFYPKEQKQERRRERKAALADEEKQEQAFGPPEPEKLFEQPDQPDPSLSSVIQEIHQETVQKAPEPTPVEYSEEVGVAAVETATIEQVAEEPHAEEEPKELPPAEGSTVAPQPFQEEPPPVDLPSSEEKQ